jgi:hypothetical protein
MQKFNRLAETDVKTHPVANKKKIDRVCQIFYLIFSSKLSCLLMFVCLFQEMAFFLTQYFCLSLKYFVIEQWNKLAKSFHLQLLYFSYVTIADLFIQIQ